MLRISLAAVVSGLLVQFGTEVISASDHVRVLGLGVTISSDLWTRTWLMSAHPAFIGCANFDESDDP